jgi:O-antigen/teichoic acid export membrane protein
MSLSRKLVLTFLIQASSFIVVSGSSIFLAHKYGPQGQGYLTYIKSLIDLANGIFLFGLPQSFIFMINSRKISKEWAINSSVIYTIFASILFLLLSTICLLVLPPQKYNINQITLISILVSFPFFLLHGLLRPIILVSRNTFVYNIVTVLPGVLIALFYFIFNSDDYRNLSSSFLASGVISAFMGIGFLRWNKYPSLSVTGFASDLKLMYSSMSYGFWSFISTVSASLVVSYTYYCMRVGTGEESDVGLFGIAVLILSAIVIPLTMIVPVLYNDWSKYKEIDLLKQTYTKISRVGFIVFLPLSVLGCYALEPLISVVFGSQYVLAVYPTKILILSSYMLYQNKIISTFLLAFGFHKQVAVASIVRTLSICLLLLCIPYSLPAVAGIWNLGEFLGVLYMFCYAKHFTKWPLKTFIGFSKLNPTI